MSVIATPASAGGRTLMKEVNVIGTMQLLAACQKAPGVRKLVVKSSSTVYGASPKDPALFTEEMEPRALPRSGFAKDSVEVEGYVRGFSRRRPDVDVSTLRFANCLGPNVRTPLSAYFELPVVPTGPRLRPAASSSSTRTISSGCSACAPSSSTRGPTTSPVTAYSPCPRPRTASASRRSPCRASCCRPRVVGAGASGCWTSRRSRSRSWRTVEASTRPGSRRAWATCPRGRPRRRFDDFARARGVHGPVSAERLEGLEERVLDVSALARQ